MDTSSASMVPATYTDLTKLKLHQLLNLCTTHGIPLPPRNQQSKPCLCAWLENKVPRDDVRAKVHHATPACSSTATADKETRTYQKAPAPFPPDPAKRLHFFLTQCPPYVQECECGAGNVYVRWTHKRQRGGDLALVACTNPDGCAGMGRSIGAAVKHAERMCMPWIVLQKISAYRVKICIDGPFAPLLYGFIEWPDGDDDAPEYTFPVRDYAHMVLQLKKLAKTRPWQDKLPNLNIYIDEVPSLHIAATISRPPPEPSESDTALDRQLDLLPFQQEGIAWILNSPGMRCLLCDDMGLGKSVQALGAMVRLNKWPVLIIAPASVRPVWMNEVEKWCSRWIYPQDVYCVMPGDYKAFDAKQTAKVVVTSYHMIRQCLAQWRSFGFQLVVCDESHLVFSTASASPRDILQASLEIVQNTPRCIMLSGTPLGRSSSPKGLFYQALALRKESSPLGTDYTNFIFRNFDTANVCRRPQELSFVLQQTLPMLKRTKGQLRSQLQRLPHKQIIEVPLVLEQKHAKILEVEYNNDVKTNFERIGLVKAHALTRSEDADKSWLALKLDACAPLDTAGQKVVLFVRHHRVADSIQQFLVRRGDGYVRIDGHLDHQSKAQMLHTFATDDSIYVALCTVESCGTGVDALKVAHIAIFLEIPDAATYHQAENRLHRIGQQSDVFIFVIVAQGAMSKKMHAEGNEDVGKDEKTYSFRQWAGYDVRKWHFVQVDMRRGRVFFHEYDGSSDTAAGKEAGAAHEARNREKVESSMVTNVAPKNGGDATGENENRVENGAMESTTVSVTAALKRPCVNGVLETSIPKRQAAESRAVQEKQHLLVPPWPCKMGVRSHQMQSGALGHGAESTPQHALPSSSDAPSSVKSRNESSLPGGPFPRTSHNLTTIGDRAAQRCTLSQPAGCYPGAVPPVEDLPDFGWLDHISASRRDNPLQTIPSPDDRVRPPRVFPPYTPPVDTPFPSPCMPSSCTRSAPFLSNTPGISPFPTPTTQVSPSLAPSTPHFQWYRGDIQEATLLSPTPHPSLSQSDSSRRRSRSSWQRPIPPQKTLADPIESDSDSHAPVPPRKSLDPIESDSDSHGSQEIEVATLTGTPGGTCAEVPLEKNADATSGTTGASCAEGPKEVREGEQTGAEPTKNEGRSVDPHFHNPHNSVSACLDAPDSLGAQCGYIPTPTRTGPSDAPEDSVGATESAVGTAVGTSQRKPGCSGEAQQPGEGHVRRNSTSAETSADCIDIPTDTKSCNGAETHARVDDLTRRKSSNSVDVRVALTDASKKNSRAPAEGCIQQLSHASPDKKSCSVSRTIVPLRIIELDSDDDTPGKIPLDPVARHSNDGCEARQTPGVSLRAECADSGVQAGARAEKSVSKIGEDVSAVQSAAMGTSLPDKGVETNSQKSNFADSGLGDSVPESNFAFKINRYTGNLHIYRLRNHDISDLEFAIFVPPSLIDTLDSEIRPHAVDFMVKYDSMKPAARSSLPARAIHVSDIDAINPTQAPACTVRLQKRRKSNTGPVVLANGNLYHVKPMDADHFECHRQACRAVARGTLHDPMAFFELFCTEKCHEKHKLVTTQGATRDVCYRAERGVCAVCKVDTEKIRDDIFNAENPEEMLPDNWVVGKRIRSAIATIKGNLRRKGVKNPLWDADHITAVAQGGGSCFASNLQTLCVQCHAEKTVSDNRATRQRKRSKKVTDVPTDSPKNGA